MSAFIIHVTFDCTDPDRLARFWTDVTGYRRSVESTDDVVTILAPDGRGVRRMMFFRVPEPKTAKNRVHVDLAATDPPAEIDRLVALGATRVEYHEEPSGKSWTVMADPEGNEFCLG